MRKTLAYPLAVLAAATLFAPQVASAAKAEDPRSEQERVRAEQAQVAANLNTSKASLSQISAALDALDANLDTQQQLLGRAQTAAARARADVAAANAAIRRITERRSILRREMADRAVQAYMRPPTDGLSTLLDSHDIDEANARRSYIEFRARSDADLADQLRAMNQDLDYQHKRAESSRREAESQARIQQQRTADVQKARDEKQRVVNGLQARVNAQTARAVQLAKTDKELSYKIAKQEAEIAMRLAAQRAAAAQAAARARDAQAASSNSGNSGGSSSGGSSSLGSTSVGSGSGMCTVDGKPISCQIASQAAAMINAARAAGVPLSIGNAYRDPAQQIELRRQHCGTSDYAIYQMPPGQCHPPTARPGASMHEVGLAIDFANCSSHGTACWQWLSGHASSYGFYNLPSEAWHWSINGH